MVITKKSLEQFLILPEHVKTLTMQKITEVESFKVFNDDPNVVIGYVISREDHPNSDHLNLTKVDVGTEVLDIVCGAANVDKGQYVIVAKVGAILPGNFEIKSAVIRGQKSEGMICSLKELGFSDKVIMDEFKSGIYYFDTPQTLGSSAYEALSLTGFSLELGLTPNRGDLLSVLGFAYDMGAMLNQKVWIPSYEITYEKEKNPFKVTIQSLNATAYYARVFKDIKIKPSPWWLAQLLIQNDIRPINNIVDITNYVMLVMGSPLHAFDLDTFGSQEVVVREAIKGEKVITLDGQERVLEPSDLMITNGKNPVALAGVMGLESTMITNHTQHVLLEAASFSQDAISKTSKRLNLKSDASLRFERGVSNEKALLGLELATYLLQTLAEAKVLDGTASDSKDVSSKIVRLPFNLVQDYLGLDLTKDEIVSYLIRYQYEVDVFDDYVDAKVPHFRTDITEPHDLIEEIARIYGLDVIPIRPLPSHLKGGYTHKQHMIRNLKRDLINKGFQEIITYSLRPEKDIVDFPLLGEPISLLMPLSEDRKYLRQSLIPGMLEALSYNVKRQQTKMHCFEMGHVFHKGFEVNHLTILMHGPFMGYQVSGEMIKPNIYFLKALLKHIETLFQVNLSFKYEALHAVYHPYQSANIYLNDKKVGHYGTLHPSLLSSYDLKDVYALTLYIDDIYGYQRLKTYEVMSKFPSVTRDLSLVMDRDMALEKPIEIIKQTLKAYLEEVTVFDVYKGEHIDNTKMSVAFRMVLNDPKQTLESDEVDKLMKKVMHRLSFELHMEVRS